MEPAIKTRTWYGVCRWGCHLIGSRWRKCHPLAPLLVSIHSISSVTGCFGSHALVHLAQRGCMDSLSVINHLYFGKPDTCLIFEEHCDRSPATPCWCPRELSPGQKPQLSPGQAGAASTPRPSPSKIHAFSYFLIGQGLEVTQRLLWQGKKRGCAELAQARHEV